MESGPQQAAGRPAPLAATHRASASGSASSAKSSNAEVEREGSAVGSEQGDPCGTSPRARRWLVRASNWSKIKKAKNKFFAVLWMGDGSRCKSLFFLLRPSFFCEILL